MTRDMLINALVTITLVEMMVAIGLGVTIGDLLAVARNWRLVARAMLANYVAVPAATTALLLLFDAPPMVAAGFLILAVCPVFARDPEAPPSPADSVQRMKLPEGFRVSLVAGEPTLVKPIGATTDERGRLWVVESHSYPNWITDGRPGKDRVLICEPDGKGGWSCRVFLDNGVNLPTRRRP